MVSRHYLLRSIVALAAGFVLLARPAVAQHAGGHEAAPAGAAAAGHDAAPHDAAHQEPNLFEGDIGNIIFTVVIFGLLLVVLGKFAWKPLQEVLSEREKAIRNSLETAQRDRQEAEKLLKQYAAQVDKAGAEVAAIIDEGKRDAEAARRRIQEETRREADELIARARREVQLASDTAIKELYDRTAELAVQVAAKIVRKTLTPEDHRQLVTESLERMKSSGGTKLN